MDYWSRRVDSRTPFAQHQLVLHTADLETSSVQDQMVVLDTADYSGWVMTPSMEDSHEVLVLRQ